MPKVLVLGEQPQMQIFLSESLYFDGHLVESVDDELVQRTTNE